MALAEESSLPLGHRNEKRGRNRLARAAATRSVYTLEAFVCGLALAPTHLRRASGRADADHESKQRKEENRRSGPHDLERSAEDEIGLARRLQSVRCEAAIRDASQA